MFEEITRARLSTLIAGVSDRTLKGEYIVVIAGKDIDITFPESTDEEV
jgi:hypothetical protein